MKKRKTYKTIFTKITAALWGMVLFLTPVNVFANGFDETVGLHRPGGGNESEITVTSVNHIDIGIDLTATLMINGEVTQTEFTIGTDDAQYVAITANPSDTEFSVSGGVSTSTDNQGNKQIRIEGDFPVGTSDNPVNYTVTLSKPIMTSGGVEVPVTLSTTTHYWDTANVCPGFQQNPGKQSGIDLKLNNGAGSSNTKGTLQIQKSLSGVTPENDITYFFRILDEAGNVYKDNVEIKIPAGHNTASIILTNLDFGAYTVEEISSYTEMNGTVLSELRYEPANAFSLSTDSSNDAVNITSTYVMPEPEKYTIQFVDFDGSIINTNEYEEGAAITIPENPERASEEPEKYNWIFKGWDKEISNVANADMTYTATYEMVNVTYSVFFMDWDDTVISQKDYFYGDYPVIPENPVRESTKEATYEFLNWDKEVKAVSEDVIYKAVYKSEAIEYTVIFKKWDNSVISETTYNYGDTVVVPADINRPADKEYIYTFTGWDKEVTEQVTENQSYTAVYEKEFISYEINFVNWNDTLISEGLYHYGDTVVEPNEPIKEADDKYTYKFIGWDKEVSSVTGNIIYKAVFQEIEIISDKNEVSDSEVIEQPNNESEIDMSEPKTERPNEESFFENEGSSNIQCQAPQTGDSSGISFYMISVMLSAVFMAMSGCRIVYAEKQNM